MAATPTIALFARYPRAGAAKTRLIPMLGADGAARLHARLVERTLATIRASGVPFALHTTGGTGQEFAAWLGPDVALVDQGEGDLGARLARVAAPAILLGADVPDLTAAHLATAARVVAQGDTAIGPAADGGYYLLGLPRPMPHLFADMAWGSDGVLAATLARLDPPPLQLETLADCDRPADLARWPWLAA